MKITSKVNKRVFTFRHLENLDSSSIYLLDKDGHQQQGVCLYFQGGVTYDVCSLFLVTVPPFLALYFGFLYLQTTLEANDNIVDRQAFISAKTPQKISMI